MAANYILALDQGTTGSTALVVDRRLNVKAKVNQEFRQNFPKPGWVEHDLEDIWTSVTETIKRALREARIKPTDIAAIGITNQRETVGAWDRKTGKAAGRAIVWQDRRTADFCAQLKADGREAMVKQKTGLVLDPYFSATKMRWMLQHDAKLAARADAGELAFGTIDTFLVSRLTGNTVHVTDVSNASRTSLFNIHTLQWDDELLQLFGVPKKVLPEVRSCSEIYGTTKGLKVLPDGIPVAGMAGDQQSALFGQNCFRPGEAKCTYGTGAFLLMNTGTTPVTSQRGLLTTVAWKLGNEVNYALEGSSFIAGAAVQWLRDGLKLIKKSSDVEALARTVKTSENVVFVPALSGLGAPHWRPHARGLIGGIDRGTTAGHLARATLEGIAFQIHDLAEAMRLDAGATIPAFKVDGGASANDLLMQFQCDLLQTRIERPKMVETTALGAAFLAGLGVGLWKSRDDVAKSWKRERTFTPRMPADERSAHLAKWQKAVALA
ncbi:MAG: glycerol kinase GlpK [Deltaproteobacteria bacterium]|nr:glycerol kinase GlpK [Deltaproteobacteria bacterium]